MAEVLVLVEHSDGTVKKVTTELLTAARVLGEPSAVVIGAATVMRATVRGAAMMLAMHSPRLSSPS